MEGSTNNARIAEYSPTVTLHGLHKRKNLISTTGDGLLVVILMGFEDLREIARISNMDVDDVKNVW